MVHIGIGQTNTAPAPNLELTGENIKRVFSLKPDMCCPVPPPEWTTCYDTDSAYYAADTVRLYSDMYYYQTTNQCYITSWNFSNSTTFSISETHVCQEPPESTIRFENCGLKMKFSRNANILTMWLYKGKKLQDKFNIVALDYLELRANQYAYRLTMTRQKV